MPRQKDPARKGKRRPRAVTEVFAPVTAATVAAAEDELEAEKQLAAAPALPPMSEVRQSYLKTGLGCFTIWLVTAIDHEVISIERLASFIREVDADRYLAQSKKEIQQP